MPRHTIEPDFSAQTEKVTPVSADTLIIADSAASNALKRVQIGNLPAGDVSGLVPYSGATGNVDIGVHTITATSFIGDGDFADASVSGTLSVGNNFQTQNIELVGGSIDFTTPNVDPEAPNDPVSGIQPFADSLVFSNAEGSITLPQTTTDTIVLGSDLAALASISSGDGAPASTPTKVGDMYIDTTGDDAYIAVGTASSADWEKTHQTLPTRDSLGLDTDDAPQFAGIELGHASDTTLSRSAAGVLAVEGVVVPTISSTHTVTNKRIQPRTASSTTAATLVPDLATANVYYRTTQTATLEIGAPIGTPVIGETILIYVDSAAAQTLTMNATYVAFGAAFPATTTAGKTLMISAQFSGSVWRTLWANAI